MDSTRPRRILHVVTNVSAYDDDPQHPTGLWLSELTHAWDVFDSRGFEQAIVSPRGGVAPLEPRSLRFPAYDSSAKAWHRDTQRMGLLATTQRPDDVDAAEYDAIYFTGGHGVMYDFSEDEELQRLTREIWEAGGVVSSVCHGYCGLLNTRLSDGTLLIAGRQITGFAWREEILAGVSRRVPYNAEQEAKNRGARYVKARLPFVPHAVTDGRLVTGQNPVSAKKTAEAVAELL
ncbi:MAG: type 1 glutamine amidotransferase domain-containing protein [Micrococcus sp.]|nr:type 1 glutamine amidotransferase domain-containing protein [Micrococcus sp.]